MIDKAISDFFDERKEAWMKKNQKASMSNDEALALQEICNEYFSLGTWLPDAARRAGQMSMATHPCTFSHPSARKNKNGYVTPVIADIVGKNDGLLRSGNVAVECDALGNAAVLDVHKFLGLRLEDGRTLMEHIEVESELARQLLSAQGNNYGLLRDGFLAMVGGGAGAIITSSKIKQIYFPVDGDYHQLSILSNSGIVFHLKKRLNAMRFSDEVKALREKKRRNEPSEEGFMELFGLTSIGYGGTKPQNISVLNNQNGGRAYLLPSMPPMIERRSVRFPKRDFFRESMKPSDVREIFHALHAIYKTDYSNQNIREGKYYRYQQLVDRIIERMWVVRSVASEQYFESGSKLAGYQKIWLLDDYAQQREAEEEWLDTLTEEIVQWIIHEYQRSMGKASVMLGKAEHLDLLDAVTQNREGLR